MYATIFFVLLWGGCWLIYHLLFPFGWYTIPGIITYILGVGIVLNLCDDIY